jgi:hypothetical protein
MGAGACKLQLRSGQLEIVVEWSGEPATESDPDGFGTTGCRLPIGEEHAEEPRQYFPRPCSAPQNRSRYENSVSPLWGDRCA